MATARTETGSLGAGNVSDRAETLVQMVLRDAALRQGTAVRFARGDQWSEMSYAELALATREIAGGLIALGVSPGERVSILCGTRPEWTLADLGSLCAGAAVAPIYHTNSPEECRYILEHADTRVVFCEDAQQLAKVEQVRDSCPALEHVVMLDGSGDGTLSLTELRRRGEQVDSGRVEQIAAGVRPEDTATIVYTSGTTGPPRGCVTTHANLLLTARM